MVGTMVSLHISNGAKKLLMERKLCELDPNCLKFYSQYFKFFCVKVKNFKDIGGKMWK